MSSTFNKPGELYAQVVLTHLRKTINVPVKWIQEFNCTTWQRDTVYKCFVTKNWQDEPDFGAPPRKLAVDEAGVYDIHIKNVFGEWILRTQLFLVILTK